MAHTSLSTGRINQKIRTRKAMLEAAAELIREQGNVTLEEVASRAQISRATAYRYFSDVNDLIIATQLPATKEPEELLEGVDDVVERALIVHDHLFEASENSESHMRAFLGAIMTKSSIDLEDNCLAMRGVRRIPMLEEVLRPIADKMSDDEFKEIVAALATMTGIEAYTVLKDVCKMDATSARAAMHRSIKSLLSPWLKD